MYKVLHRQVFHLNSKPQIYHILTLQVISHQIKDDTHNHRGSIGLYKGQILVGNLALVVLDFLFYVSLPLLFGVGQEDKQKDLVCN